MRDRLEACVRARIEMRELNPANGCGGSPELVAEAGFERMALAAGDDLDRDQSANGEVIAEGPWRVAGCYGPLPFSGTAIEEAR